MITGLVDPGDLHMPEPASIDQLRHVHDSDYLERVFQGRLSDKEVRRIGFPWSAQLVERSRRSVAATICASRAAVEEGVSANLAGGTHHAYPDHGEGYYVFNDVAIAARTMQAEGIVHGVLILDCDVHQGNGTAAIFASDPSVFTFSIHGEKNFPFHKEHSDLDIALPDKADDRTYLAALDSGLQVSIARARAELVIYLAGADPFMGDRLGRLALSKPGLTRRDRLVLDYCRAARLPVAITMAGGYARQIEDTVDIHYQTVQIALEYATFQERLRK